MAKNKRCSLIGIDDDEVSLAAFQFYVEHLHRPGSRLVLVHIVLPPVKSTNQLALTLEAGREASILNEKQRVRGLQDKYEDLMRAYKVAGGINVIYYSLNPGKILCEVAAEEKCSLIILGARCNPSYLQDPELIGTDEGVIHLGELATYVLKKSPCPVLVTRPYELLAQNERGHTFQDTFNQEITPPREKRRATLELPNEPRIRKTSWPPPNPYLIHNSGEKGGGYLEAVKDEEKRRHSHVVNPFPAIQSKLSEVKKFFGGNTHSDESVDEDETVT